MTQIMFDYFRVLEGYEFEPDDDGETFRSPGGRVLVTIADRAGTLAVTALTGDRARLICWTTLINNAPAEVLDAALRAAEPDLANRVHSGPTSSGTSVRPGRRWSNSELNAALGRGADRRIGPRHDRRDNRDNSAGHGL
jgi:hypothetical protein